jgi:hypothetical protein
VWIGTSRSEFTSIQVDWRPFMHFESNVKIITFCTLELVHQVGGFTVSKGGDGDVRANE